ncbi:MAG: CPBP family intramembrane metalloprotease [Aliifodinibius sp.]|nr:CPBP family intramembrane metalloprotease [Fodinibius sp.]NIV16321.1 CPBP family intramembrane metalloprotease [Fodinibius sp.]NIY30288.1 CPBP family intramembrane metalloprotease [Fodinibius sp.]
MLQLLGNLASVPMLQATNIPVEPVGYWLLYTALSFILIGISLFIARQIRLGASLLEGLLKKEEITDWAKRVLALSLLFAIVGSMFILLLNLNTDPESVPAIWKIILASIDAGVQEEIFYRFFLMTLLVWLGGLIWQDKDGKPKKFVFWTAIGISAIIFAWAHLDDKIVNPEIPASSAAYVTAMMVNASLGIILGWLYWKYGLESAMLAHFLIDAIGIGIVMPVYLSSNLLLQVAVITGLLLVAVAFWHMLMNSSIQL